MSGTRTDRLRDQVVVYLSSRDRELLEEMVESTGLARTELFRRGLRRLATEVLTEGEPGSSLDYLIDTASEDDFPPDVGEFHSHLLYLCGPEEAHRALLRLLDDPIHEWRAAPPELVGEATVNWLFRFRDQAFSLVDAVSFEIMERQGLTHAFAFDRHFETAGFALLRAG